MKKTLIALMALAGVASATTTDFLDLSQTSINGHLTFDAATSTITTDSENGADLWEINNAGLQTILALKINLTKAQKVTTDTAIVSLDFVNGNNDLPDIGLMATSAGLSASLGG